MLKKIEQLIEECSAWKRLLDFLQAENVAMKSRLAEMIRFSSKDAISEIEDYQNMLITKDITFALYRKDVVEHINKLKQCGDTVSMQLAGNQNKLRDEIKKLEQEFSKLRFEFNNYLMKAS